MESLVNLLLLLMVGCTLAVVGVGVWAISGMKKADGLVELNAVYEPAMKIIKYLQYSVWGLTVVVLLLLWCMNR